MFAQDTLVTPDIKGEKEFNRNLSRASEGVADSAQQTQAAANAAA